LFSKNPIKRIGVVRFLRNVAIAIGNSGDADLIDTLHRLIAHESPLVRGATVWSLARLLPYESFKALANERADDEPDQSVRDEWQWGLQTVQ
jgi:epoxyqueuosine reductase